MEKRKKRQTEALFLLKTILLAIEKKEIGKKIDLELALETISLNPEAM